MNRKSIRPWYTLCLLAIMLVLVAGCGTKATDVEAASRTNTTTPAATKDKSKAVSHPIVTIVMNDGKKIKLELYPEVAPNTVNNFISLVQKGAYNGTIFHRVIPGFMIQGGDPQGNGTGGPGYSIKGEFKSNGFNNTLKHTRGVLSMARSADLDSAGSQFFIMVADADYLDGQYAAFGKVTSGMDVVDAIVNSKRDSNDKPIKPATMKKVTVDTLGKKYPEPVKVK
ncbi:peptidylprolyl isomerase [Paenibacillus polymyxa]|uniref:peptidylprolyl isomerase n=1 Tax=Paenibacillus jamilae TaxID=114136 RepID=UPI0007AB945A|nr:MULTISPECIES: peptidylprolyl isomerase [Paenibacillus]KZE69917.1 peptidylprolyl isomerase [Paenibacillus jamilae]OBA08241.1 peptidylprolyl isomerase [Paenibacillus polymyxa]QDY85793.1 peptidylprolyl isomerase [Paenibacillus polymyxa]